MISALVMSSMMSNQSECRATSLLSSSKAKWLANSNQKETLALTSGMANSEQLWLDISRLADEEQLAAFVCRITIQVANTNG